MDQLRAAPVAPVMLTPVDQIERALNAWPQPRKPLVGVYLSEEYARALYRADRSQGIAPAAGRHTALMAWRLALPDGPDQIMAGLIVVAAGGAWAYAYADGSMEGNPAGLIVALRHRRGGA